MHENGGGEPRHLAFSVAKQEVEKRVRMCDEVPFTTQTPLLLSPLVGYCLLNSFLSSKSRDKNDSFTVN